MSTTKMELEVNESTGKFYIHNKTNNNNSHSIHSDRIEQTTATNTLVSSIKSFVSNIFIKPIIDMTSMIVGTDLTDNNHHHHETNSLSISLKSMLWNETTTNDCGGVVINGKNKIGVGGGVGVVMAANTTMNGSSPTKSPPTIYLDNHSSDRIFISSCEKSVVLMNFYQQDTFFDCDDYIDGGEDTIDFVADSTKIQYNSYGDELLPTKHLNDSPKNNCSALSTFDKTPELFKNDVNIKTEQPIPSPEIIPYGCIFTKFFRLDNSKEKSPLLAMCYKQHKARQLQQINKPTSKERPSMSSSSSSLSMSPCRRTSEIESDDSFIVFEESSPKSTNSVDDLIGTTPTTTTLKNYYNRQRQLSECSDDFILFEGDPDDDTTDEDFTDSTDDSDSEDESDIESDCLDYTAILMRKHDVENKDQPDSGFEENKDQDSGPEEKKVTFNLRPTVHEIRAWNYAYSEARKGKWEQMGRDRERFEKRINELSHILSPILKADHRQKIYKQRFNDEHVNHNTKHKTQHISNKRKKLRK
ncbi:uncharacterized protein LOC116346518 [Contarinia nasturtii]|uniref:uncharacterized protein LOC116346518 n=1 Tax=Contarinia nasturtii TaxID=265458 RepID=UPI0012D45596|nr:uncharacterized protein LOC116346518 [Contarinia nasturtii]